MKVLNLRCSHQHSFEGWFASEDDFQSQLTRGLIECPLCADKGVQKLPSAPRLNFGGHQVPEMALANSRQARSIVSAEATAPGSPGGILTPDGVTDPQHFAQGMFLKALRQVLAHTEDVGHKFADEARRMHHGEVEARGIRGEASAREAVELMEEGIEVMPLPMLPMLKETLQ